MHPTASLCILIQHTKSYSTLAQRISLSFCLHPQTLHNVDCGGRLRLTAASTLGGAVGSNVLTTLVGTLVSTLGDILGNNVVVLATLVCVADLAAVSSATFAFLPVTESKIPASFSTLPIFRGKR